MTKSAYQELLACAIRNPSTEPRLCRLLPREFGVPVPWEELDEAGLRRVGDLGEDVSEPGLWIDVVEFLRSG